MGVTARIEFDIFFATCRWVRSSRFRGGRLTGVCWSGRFCLGLDFLSTGDDTRRDRCRLRLSRCRRRLPRPIGVALWSTEQSLSLSLSVTVMTSGVRADRRRLPRHFGVVFMSTKGSLSLSMYRSLSLSMSVTVVSFGTHSCLNGSHLVLSRSGRRRIVVVPHETQFALPDIRCISINVGALATIQWITSPPPPPPSPPPFLPPFFHLNL
jgi:hypothetical protein